MGPAAWAAVGEALAVALAASAFGGKNSLATILGRQIHHAIVQHDLEMAAALVRDLAYRNHAALEAFLEKYGDELPKEFREEFLNSSQ